MRARRIDDLEQTI
jgi:hypothetical protein